MRLSKAGETLMHRFEGCRNKPYLCPAHIWTIGYGHVLYQEQIRLPMVRPPGKTKEDIPMIRSEFPLKPEETVSGRKKRSTNYSELMSELLNGVFFVLFPAWLGGKALLTLLSLFPITSG